MEGCLGDLGCVCRSGSSISDWSGVPCGGLYLPLKFAKDPNLERGLLPRTPQAPCHPSPCSQPPVLP